VVSRVKQQRRDLVRALRFCKAEILVISSVATSVASRLLEERISEAPWTKISDPRSEEMLVLRWAAFKAGGRVLRRQSGMQGFGRSPLLDCPKNQSRFGPSYCASPPKFSNPLPFRLPKKKAQLPPSLETE
jgi:hypothetical protein